MFSASDTCSGERAVVGRIRLTPLGARRALAGGWDRERRECAYASCQAPRAEATRNGIVAELRALKVVDDPYDRQAKGRPRGDGGRDRGGASAKERKHLLLSKNSTTKVCLATRLGGVCVGDAACAGGRGGCHAVPANHATMLGLIATGFLIDASSMPMRQARRCGRVALPCRSRAYRLTVTD